MHKKKGVNRVRPSRLSRISPMGVDVMGTIADGSQRDFLRLENLDVDIPPDSVVLTRTQELVTQDASKSYLPFVGQTRLREVAARHVSVIAGAPVLNQKDELQMAALVFRPDASVLVHTKQYLHAGEEVEFTPGFGGSVLQIEGTTVALAICADTTHLQHPASAAARGANVYAASVLITAKGYERDAALLRQCAIEHRMAVLVSNYSGNTGGLASAGNSTIWSEDGTVVAASAGTKEALVVGRRANSTWDGVVLPL